MLLHRRPGKFVATKLAMADTALQDVVAAAALQNVICGSSRHDVVHGGGVVGKQSAALAVGLCADSLVQTRERDLGGVRAV